MYPSRVRVLIRVPPGVSKLIRGAWSDGVSAVYVGLSYVRVTSVTKGNICTSSFLTVFQFKIRHDKARGQGVTPPL